jgi:hypothetical protein
MHEPSLGMAAELARQWPLTNTSPRSKLGARGRSFESANNECPDAFRDPFDSPAFDTLSIASLTGSSPGDDDAEDR